jgi:hypothetical protein
MDVAVALELAALVPFVEPIRTENGAPAFNMRRRTDKENPA